MTRLLRAPLLHFLLLGGALLALQRWWAPEEARDPRPRIAIGADDVARLRETWTAEHGTPPGPAAEAGLVRAAIDEEILYREALARGFDRRDATVRERLVRLGGFVGEEAGGSRDALEAQARRLGLERSDLVIRRHLVDMMRLAAGWLGPDDLPSEPDLDAYLARHADEYAVPDRIHLTQVYVSAERHGAGAERDAVALLRVLRATPVAPGDVAGRGDAFIHGADVEGSRTEVDRAFGPGFAQAVDGLPLRAWAGPVRSSYGLHLVWVHRREPGRVPALAEVRGRVLQRVLRERSEQRARETLDAMRARYAVEVAGLAQ